MSQGAPDEMLRTSIVQSRPIEELYYSQGDLVHAAAEVENFDNFTQSFQNLTWGSASSFLISQSIQSWGDAILRMVIPAPGAGQTLSVPLGFSVIDRVNIYLGGSVQFTVSGRAIMNSAIAACETSDKIAQMLSLANGGFGLTTQITGPIAGNIECIIPLNVLFSSIEASEQRKGVNIDLTNAPLTIEVYTKSPAYFSTGGYAASGMTSGQLIAKSAFFKDRNKSIKNFLLSNPTESYYSPEIFIQEIVSPSTTVSNLGSTPTVFNFSNFRKSKCVGLWLTFVSDANDVAGIDHFKLTPMTDIRVDRDGTVLHTSPGSSYQLKQLFETLCPFSYDCYGQVNTPALINFTQDAYYMNGSISKQLHVNDGYQLQGSTLNVSFAVNSGAPVSGKLYLHVLYQGFMKFSNGICEFIY